MSVTIPGRNNSPLGNPHVQSYDLAVSQSINPGDWVVLTNGGGSNIRVRKLTSADIAANYTVSATLVGVLGIAMYSAFTDANGAASVATTPSTVAAGAAPYFPEPSYASSIDGDSNQSGVARLSVALADGNQTFIMRAQTTANAAVTVTSNTESQSTGIQVYNTTDFAWNFGATSTGIVGFISGVHEQDANFNVSSTQCLVEGKIFGTYGQFVNGQLYNN